MIFVGVVVVGGREEGVVGKGAGMVVGASA